MFVKLAPLTDPNNPDHVPVVIVPTEVKLDETTAEGRAVPAKFAAGKPVVFVRVPLEGVPKAPPLTTNAPAEPTATARAIATPVPNPLMPVDTGKPVALVNVPLEGVPRAPLNVIGAPAEPIAIDKAEATPVPRPLIAVLIGTPVKFVPVNVGVLLQETAPVDPALTGT